MRFNQLIPEFMVSAIDQSLNFYINVLGFKIEYSRPESNFYFLSRNKNQIMLFQDETIKENKDKWVTGELNFPRGRGINFQIEVKNIDRLLNIIRSVGFPIYIDKNERWRTIGTYEIRQFEFLVQDPDGYLLRFSETIEKRRKR